MASGIPSSIATPESDECYYTYDIVIVGAGIIGLSIARNFPLHSQFSVAIIDASTPLTTGAGTYRMYQLNIFFP